LTGQLKNLTHLYDFGPVKASSGVYLPNVKRAVATPPNRAGAVGTPGNGPEIGVEGLM